MNVSCAFSSSIWTLTFDGNSGLALPASDKRYEIVLATNDYTNFGLPNPSEVMNYSIQVDKWSSTDTGVLAIEK